MCLPSGQWVSISSERARFHATRRKLQVVKNSPEALLRHLVDVLYIDKKSGEDYGSLRQHFTGYTLGDSDWLQKWKKADRISFEAWLEDAPQKLEIEAARRRIIYDSLPQHVAYYDYPRRLYSLLKHRIRKLPMKRASAAQWRNTLLNMTSDGVRMEEIRWSGVLDFLDNIEANRVVHRDDIARRINFSGLHLVLSNELVRQREYRLPFQECARMQPYEGCPAVLRYVEKAFGFRVLLLKQERPTPCWLAMAPDGKELGRVPNAAAAQAMASQDARRRYGMKPAMVPGGRYAHVTLDGGKDYREWLLTLPEFPDSHFTPHFTERNLLLHIRTTRRTDHRQRDLLFIEEIQSDWNQHAPQRCNHWDRPVPAAPFKRDWLLLALKIVLMYAVASGIHYLAWTPGDVQQRRYGGKHVFLKRLYDDELPGCLAALSAHWQGRMESTRIPTRDPWLRVHRLNKGWGAGSTEGNFQTRRPMRREQALELAARHSRKIHLPVPLFRLPEQMVSVIQMHGLPLYGARHDDGVLGNL